MNRVLRRDTASGRFLLRINSGLHAALRGAARALGMSLNDYCVRKLAAPVGSLAAVRGATDTVMRAARLFGDRLIGAVAFGSWARGQAAAGSDVDVLIILEPDVPLTRELYRVWDEAPVAWDGRPVEPHFVHLPGPDATTAGLWAEVAVDAIVLFERDLRVSSRLAQVRRDIVAGRLVRRVVHGQPYWTAEA